MTEGLLLKGGGHAMAAGVTLRKDALAPFRAYLEDALGAAVEAARRDDALLIDGALTRGRGDQRDVAMLARAGPFGAGNPEPVVALPAHTIVYAEEVGQAHVRARLRAGDGAILNAIAFRAAGQKLGTALCCRAGAARACGGLALRSTAGRARSGCSCDCSTSLRRRCFRREESDGYRLSAFAKFGLSRDTCEHRAVQSPRRHEMQIRNPSSLDAAKHGATQFVRLIVQPLRKNAARTRCALAAGQRLMRPRKILRFRAVAARRSLRGLRSRAAPTP